MRVMTLTLGIACLVFLGSACASSVDPVGAEPVARTSQALGPNPNGSPCVSSGDCASGYCYPGPDQDYCIAATANCAEPGTNGAQYGSNYVFGGVTYYCDLGVGLVKKPFPSGAACVSASDCSSGYCYPGPDQDYCIAATANCAQPGTGGVQYGTSYTYQGGMYDCVAGQGIVGTPFPNGLPCTSGSECASTYCYPGPDQYYCIAASANCAQPGTSGVQYGARYVYNGVTYDCVLGEGLSEPPFADGLPCSGAGDCSSSYCYPGPDQNYCIAATANCAEPGTSGAQFGTSYLYSGVIYNCIASVGLEAPPFTTGLACQKAADCESGYCYSGPDNDYCITATANCAQPNTAGVQYGTSYTYNGVEYECLIGVGLVVPPFANGAPCETPSDCTSGYCYPGPDQPYCIAESANCAQPGTSGTQYGTSYTYHGTEYECLIGVGLVAPPFANGAPCETASDCTSGYCYPGPDQSYCIAESANCAQPGTSGIAYGQGYAYQGTTYTCAVGHGLEACTSETCSQLGLDCAGTDNCGVPIECGACTSPQTCVGGVCN